MISKKADQHIRVLFVCTANVCRSPMAEAILQKKIDEEGFNDRMEAASCGVIAMDGQKASRLTIKVGKENGLDLTHHRSKSITAWDLKNSSLILTMTPEHRNEILNYYSADSGKVSTLKGFGRHKSIPTEAVDDPYGLNLNFYRRIYHEIEQEITRIFPELIKMIDHIDGS